MLEEDSEDNMWYYHVSEIELRSRLAIGGGGDQNAPVEMVVMVRHVLRMPDNRLPKQAIRWNSQEEATWEDQKTTGEER